MPVAMVTCALCKQEVTKRSTLALSVLGAGDGRACRSHQEVAQLVDLLAEVEQNKRDQRAADREARVLIGAAGIRVMVSVLGVSEVVLYYRLAQGGYDADMLGAVRARVQEMGGPIMTVQEIGAMMLDSLASK